MGKTVSTGPINSTSTTLRSVLLECSVVAADLHLTVPRIPSISQVGRFGVIMELHSKAIQTLKSKSFIILSLESELDL